MKVIIGLGNPGKQYEDTRHNVGFLAIDKISKQLNIPLSQMKFRAIIGEGNVSGEKVLLVKPQTYMNLSGETVGQLVSYYKITANDLIVIYDDLDLPVGKLRLRVKGSAGGHNGIKSIIAHLGTQEFNRIKIGIDRPEQGKSISDYVLHSFPKSDMSFIQDAIDLSAKACEDWVQGDTFVQVMNHHNPTRN
ncbi:aminoacyl-tRNA hydrolase [Brevibacillus daliensis]|uniref:aminoacyl-tRNA hydrolase n=1 Tax=Brevibacillus daliensis TaxID=2892995 RepID=UPI001E55908A|nr:aminoacyl-tRNA hydrolase [Brevibacillus daliensis]